MYFCDCGFSEPTLISLHCCRKVTASNSDCPQTITIVRRCSPTVVWEAVAAVGSDCGLTTAGAFNSALPYFISLSPMQLAGSPPSRLSQFVKSRLLLPTTLNAVLSRFSDCPHHPARSIIIIELAELFIFFIIILIFFSLLISGTYTITQTVSDRIQHVFKLCFGLSSCLTPVYSSCHMLHNRCLCVLNSLLCHSCLSLHNILDAFLSLFIA
jgi:hypothetical protein